MVNVIAMDPQLRKQIISVLPEDRHLGRIYKNLRETGDKMKAELQPWNPIKNGFKLDMVTGLLYMVRENASDTCRTRHLVSLCWNSLYTPCDPHS